MLRKQSRKDCGDAAVTVRKDYGSSEDMVRIKCGANAVPLRLRRLSALLDPGPEEVGHAYGPARNSVSRMVSKHCKINVETALEVRFCTCPVARSSLAWPDPTRKEGSGPMHLYQHPTDNWGCDK